MSLRRPSRCPAFVLLAAFVLPAVPAPAAENSAATRAAESEARLKRDVTFLASDACEGRGPTTQGLNKAADYIAAEFKKAGLKPGGPEGSYFQPFTLPGSVQEGPARLVLKGPRGQVIELKEGVHFYPMALGYAGKVTAAPVVFAGYGISSETLNYDDYLGLDAEDKVVVVVRDAPRAGGTGPSRAQASFLSKINRAEKAGAAALLIVNDADAARDGDDLLDFNYTAVGARGGKIPVFHVKRSVLETMLQSAAAKELSAVEAEIRSDMKPQSRDLTGWTASLEVKMSRSKDAIKLKNVVGVLEGDGPLAKETVVVGAHYDHLGYGGAGGSLAGLKKMAIHHGADDNGSGTTAVLELARRFGALKDRQGRRLVFMTFSGEELGLDGSKYYCEHPLFPLEDTAAMLNLDMVGRGTTDKDTNKDNLLVEGSSTSKAFDELLDTLNKKYDFKMKRADKFLPNSDHHSFYQKKIPVLFFWTGIHPDYHRPSDTADKINVPGMRKIVDLSEDVLAYFTTAEKRFDYVAGKVGGRSSPGSGPRLGVRPDYNDGQDGLLLEGVTDGLPAAKAGMKAGDRIIELAGKPVKSLETYMDIMAAQKRDTTIDAVILRDGKKVPLKVKLD